MKTIPITLDESELKLLTNISQKLNIEKVVLLQKAIKEYLEDLHDAMVIEERLKNDDGTRYTIEEAKEQLGL